MDDLTRAAAAEAILGTTGRRVRPRKKKPRTLDLLLQAKAESDRRNYRAKEQILRDLILADPASFQVDSEDNGIVGLTHQPTSFRIHTSRRSLPVPLVRLGLKGG